jgi:hypothetical protein
MSPHHFAKQNKMKHYSSPAFHESKEYAFQLKIEAIFRKFLIWNYLRKRKK